MNPLLFKAHPLQRLTVDLLADPASHPLNDFAFLILIYLLINAPWAVLSRWAILKTTACRIAYRQAYPRALAPLLLYVPIQMTILSDVIDHAFRMADRFILVFALFVAVQMLAALFAVSLKAPRSKRPIGVRAGLTASLLLFLLALPYALALLGVDAWTGILQAGR